MLKIKKEDLELNIIPCIMAILSIIIAFVDSEITRKIIVLANAILLGMQIQKCYLYFKNKKGE